MFQFACVSMVLESTRPLQWALVVQFVEVGVWAGVTGMVCSCTFEVASEIVSFIFGFFCTLDDNL